MSLFQWRHHAKPDRPHRDYVFHVALDREDDGRWIAEVEDIPGALAYGATEEEAINKVYALVFRVVADRLEHDELTVPSSLNVQLIPRECLAL